MSQHILETPLPRNGGETHPAPSRARVSLAALWFGLVAAPAAWSVQTLVNLPVASHGCFPQLYRLSSASSYSIQGIAFIVSIAAVAVCIAALVVASRSWRRTRAEQHPSSGSASGHSAEVSALETGEGRTRFMAMAGALTSLTFTLVSLVHLVTVFLVGPC